MSTIDPRTLELIHAEADGALDPAHAQELQERLAADPQARLVHGQWRRISEALARMPVVDPPAGLARRWQGRGGPGPATNHRQAAPPRRWLRPAIGLAAAGLAVAVALQLGDGGRLGLDPEQLMGTLGTQAPAQADGQSQSVSAGDLRADVSLLPGDRAWRLAFDLRSQGPLQVEASWNPEVLRLLEVGRVPGDLRRAPGSIAFTSQGAQHAELQLQPQAGGQLHVRIQGREGESRHLVFNVPESSSEN